MAASPDLTNLGAASMTLPVFKIISVILRERVRDGEEEGLVKVEVIEVEGNLSKMKTHSSINLLDDLSELAGNVSGVTVQNGSVLIG